MSQAAWPALLTPHRPFIATSGPVTVGKQLYERRVPGVLTKSETWAQDSDTSTHLGLQRPPIFFIKIQKGLCPVLTGLKGSLQVPEDSFKSNLDPIAMIIAHPAQTLGPNQPL